MLIQLHIENVAVIEDANIDFSEGFNVLTGETGAGKSIIIDSINAVTGEKTSKDIIRSGTSKAKITAVFCDISNNVVNALNEIGYAVSEDGMIMLSRELSTEGKSVFRLNGSIVPMMIIKQISPLLINIHGQHDNQQLFSPSKHIKFIDGYGELEQDVAKYNEVYKKMSSIKEKLSSIQTNDELKERRIELLKFQIEEIEAASLEIGEEEELISRRDIIRNSEELSDNVSLVCSLFGGDEQTDGIISIINRASDAIGEISNYAEELSSLSERTTAAVYELEEIFSEIRSLDGAFEFNPQELNDIEERLDLIFRLKQKYGASIEEILKKLKELSNELESINSSEQNIFLLEKEYAELKSKAEDMALTLSKKRKMAVRQLCDRVMQELSFLDMPNVLFSASHNIVSLKNDGCDQIEFLISANKGEEAKPLSKIASGGELSRIMLAIKTVLSMSDETETLIFDEIDTGVSGKTARKIGEKMREISNKKQVLCVTHLAQIASLANNHLLIKKDISSDRTYTSVRSLNNDERIYEVARIMGGEQITQATLEAAQELIK